MAHSVRFAIKFNPGPANDVVRIYVDGVLVHTGTTWEDYYRYDPEAGGNGNVLSPISKMLFRESGDANVGNNGNGFLIDALTVNSLSTGVSATPIGIKH